MILCYGSECALKYANKLCFHPSQSKLTAHACVCNSSADRVLASSTHLADKTYALWGPCRSREPLSSFVFASCVVHSFVWLTLTSPCHLRKNSCFPFSEAALVPPAHPRCTPVSCRVKGSVDLSNLLEARDKGAYHGCS